MSRRTQPTDFPMDPTRNPRFMASHELFDKVPEEVEAFSDMLAERVGGLGGTAEGTIQTTADLSRHLALHGIDLQLWFIESHMAPKQSGSVKPALDQASHARKSC